MFSPPVLEMALVSDGATGTARLFTYLEVARHVKGFPTAHTDPVAGEEQVS